tara:strand:- start:151 stop:444 length:294 start_codon:yes stop_codon:yes gene_type:complete
MVSNKNKEKKMEYKFKIGDKVKSEPSEVATMQATWKAVIYEVKEKNKDGGCYETLGHWEPIKDKDGNLSDFWAGRETAEPTLRQLHGNHLVLDKEAE